MLRRLLLVAVLVSCASAGAWATLRIAGPATYPTTLGDVQLDVAPAMRSERGLEVYVPLADWGLRARVTSAPVRVTAEPRRIDREGLVETVTGAGGDHLRLLRRELTVSLEDAAGRAAGLAVAGSLLGGLLAALAWASLGVRGRRLALAPAGALTLGLAVTGGLTGWVGATWDAERLERPVYYASGTELQRLLEQAGQLRRTGRRYADRVDVALRSIAGLLDTHGTPAPEPGQRLVLASDLHNNLLTLPTLRRYAAGLPVVLAGDFTVNGSRMEAEVLQGLEGLGRPVVAVAGNHDSPGLMRTLARRGVTVLAHRGRLRLDGRVSGPAVQGIGGLRVAGFEDALQYRGGAYPDGIRAAMSFGDFPDSQRRFRSALAERWAWWRALPQRPQVLVAHHEGLGRALGHLIWEADPDGPPLAILVGHTHRQRLDRLGPVTVVNSGSVGAGGVFGAGRDSVGIALLDFTAGGRLEAVDLVQTDPSTTAARARRVVVRRPDCDGRLVFCPAEPAPPPLPGAGVIAAPAGPRGPASRDDAP